MSGAPLYVLTGAYQQLLELAEDGADVGDALAELDDAIEAKAAGVVRVLAQLDADAAAAAGEAKRLAARTKAFEANADRLRQYLKDCMKASNVLRIKTAQFSITLSDGQPRVEITDLAAVPPELTRVVPESREADKRAILALHKQTGEIPPGCDIVETKKLTVR